MYFESYWRFFLRYRVVDDLGNADEYYRYYIILEDDEDAAFAKAVFTQTPLNRISKLRDICDQAYCDIEDEAIQDYLVKNHPLFLKGFGEEKMDLDVLNELVHNKDMDAINYFGLENLSDEDLGKWDAHNLDSWKIPYVKRFYPDFKEVNPFDNGWSLEISLPDVREFRIKREQIEEYIKFLAKNKRVYTIKRVVKAIARRYKGDVSLEEFAKDIVTKAGLEY